LDLSSIH